MPVVIREKLTAIEGHAESLLTEKYTTPGGRSQEYLFILREIDGIERWLKKVSTHLQAYLKIREAVNEEAHPELVLKKIEKIIRSGELTGQSHASACLSREISAPGKREPKINNDMARHSLDSALLSKVLHKTIDLFLTYQYQNGFEEPTAREQAIMDIMGKLEAGRKAITNLPHADS